MEEVFGKVTPFMILSLLMLGVEWIKRNYKLKGRHVQLVALGLSLIFIVIYQTVIAWPNLTPIGVFSSFIYAFVGWLVTIGMYEVGIKKHGEDNDG